MTNFLIVITGYNCHEYVGKCLSSVWNQIPGNYKKRVVVFNDGSTDNTGVEIHEHLNVAHNKRLNGWLHLGTRTNMGAAHARHLAISHHGRPGDVIVLLGLDDELLPGALNRIAQEYEAGKWMTYGNWINQYGVGLPPDFELEFCETTHANRSYRQARYRSTAPNTFRIELFNRIPEADFKLNGRWIDTTTESEVMFSCLEMCGKERIGVIKEPIYLYNQNLPNGTQRRLGQGYKNEVYAEIIKRPKKPQVFNL